MFASRFCSRWQSERISNFLLNLCAVNHTTAPSHFTCSFVCLAAHRLANAATQCLCVTQWVSLNLPLVPLWRKHQSRIRSEPAFVWMSIYFNRGEINSTEVNWIMTEGTFMTILHYCWSSPSIFTQCNHAPICDRGVTVQGTWKHNR